MKKLILAALSGVVLGACSSGEDDGNTAATAIVEEDGVRFENATFRPPIGGRDIGAGYLTITATGDGDVSVIGVSTGVAATSELHTHLMVDGRMAMREVQSYDIAAGDSLELRTGAEHLMFYGVTDELTKGQQVPVSLTYTVGNSAPREVEIDFTVTPLD